MGNLTNMSYVPARTLDVLLHNGQLPPRQLAVLLPACLHVMRPEVKRGCRHASLGTVDRIGGRGTFDARDVINTGGVTLPAIGIRESRRETEDQNRAEKPQTHAEVHIARSRWRSLRPAAAGMENQAKIIGNAGVDATGLFFNQSGCAPCHDSTS